MNDYRKLMEDISVPRELEARVLLAAQQRNTEPAAKRSWRPVLRGAVCAACALALVLGSVRLVPREGAAPGAALDYAFCLTAYAAETGETVMPNANGGLALAGSKGKEVVYTVLDRETMEQGIFTNYRFQISGGNIQTVELSVDRGGLYRLNGTGEMESLGSSVREPYDQSVSYGLWIAPEELREGTALFDGAELQVTAVFSDGTEKTGSYRLTRERLRAFQNEDGTVTLVPGVAGDEQADTTGLYAAWMDGCWLQWPVRDSRTVSLSYPYGLINGKAHNGIDILAGQGADVLAAADGTVTEVEYDRERGSYLVLEHGNGLSTVYAHCLSVGVKTGDTVKAGETVAAVGATGMATGPHLHFEVRQDGKAQNPVAYFDSAIRDTLAAE